MMASTPTKAQSTERDRDLEAKRRTRSKAAEVHVPEPADMQRRLRCLADPEMFLRTYFAAIFYSPFCTHHKRMIQALYDRFNFGGDKSEAAPRGDGKSQIAIGMTIYGLHACAVRFPVLIGSTTKKGGKLFAQVKSKYNNGDKYPEFSADFPEVTACVRALQGAPQRALKQHVRGELTRITWSNEAVVFPSVKCDWDTNKIGQKRIAYFGLDAAIRGEGFEEDRPDVAIIDDPETREVAFSPTDKWKDIEDMIDGDVAGLSGPDKEMARIVLTTCQNNRSYSARVTDPKIKPAFGGHRSGQLLKYPDRMDLWDEYIAIRNRDKDEAKKFYVDNMEAMKAGAELANPYRFVSKADKDGEAREIDALQAFFNRVADWGWARVKAELQNDPEDDSPIESSRITPGIVASRMSGFDQGVLPKVDEFKTVYGLDLGKHASHWTKAVSWGQATSVIPDYGVLENYNMDGKISDEAIEKEIHKSLHRWRSEILADGTPDLVFIDSGNWSNVVYSFIREVGAPFCAVKGRDNERISFDLQTTPTRLMFERVRAELKAEEGIWLYYIDGQYWKSQTQQRFLTPTFNEAQQFNDGTLSIYSTTDRKKHLAFSHHICAEMLEEQFLEGKGWKRQWLVKSKNNHWLDSTAYAMAALGCLGCRVLPQVQREQPALQKHQSQGTPIKNPYGRPFLATERK